MQNSMNERFYQNAINIQNTDYPDAEAYREALENNGELQQATQDSQLQTRLDP